MSESRRSAACANELHMQCPHLMQLRLTGGTLCRCTCHFSCPVSGPDAVELGVWWDGCTCPGSGQRRAEGRRRWRRDRPPTMYELDQQLRERYAALSRAKEAIVTRARGLPANTIRQLLVEELRAQGAEVPDDFVLDLEVSDIQSAVPPGAGLWPTVRALVSSYREMRSAERRWRSAQTHAQLLQGPHGEQPYVTFDTDYSLPMVQVVADQQALTQLALPGGEVYVSLLPQAGSEPYQVAVFIGEYQVGVLPAGDGARYQPAMAAAREKGAVLMVKGVIESPSGGEKQLRIYPAGIL